MSQRNAHRRGFTLLEIMVAVAAATLLVLAVASLFGSAGDTVSAGRRLSTMTRQAALLERQIRRDLDSITRDGFLVIRHQAANDGPGGDLTPWKVRSSPDQASGRLRRVDEIAFFIKGEAETARAPIVPGYNARGGASRVYYGHGAVADAEAPLELLVPEYDMGLGSGRSVDPQVDLGLLGDEDGPNGFAGGWLLLRHQTVLAKPAVAHQELPGSFPAPYQNVNSPQTRELMRDSDQQIAFQPAMPSLFRTINTALGTGEPVVDPGAEDLRRGPSYRRGSWLVPQSGLFDVATTSLQEVRAYVTGMHDGPVASEYDGVGVGAIRPNRGVFRRPVDVARLTPRSYSPAEPLPPTLGANPGPLLASMHAWMRNALPTHVEDSSNQDLGVEPLNGIRMHAEAVEPRLDYVLDEDNFSANYPETLEAVDRINEQRMLSSGVIAPRCSEFMVEWSFGLTNRDTGELIWYGGNMFTDTDGDGIADEVRIRSYRDSTDADNDPPLGLHRVTGRASRFTNPSQSSFVHPSLIHGFSRFDARDQKPLLSYFGYHDPTYEPEEPDHLQTLPWAWPRLLRFTFTLADPNDPAIERTFQFVYEIDPER